MNKKVCFKYRGKKMCVNAFVCDSVWKKFLGLMFCRREKAFAQVFEFSKPTRVRIHSFFVFLDFIAIWINPNGKIVDLKVVKSWKFFVSSKKPFNKLIEIPINSRYFQITKSLVGKNRLSRRS